MLAVLTASLYLLLRVLLLLLPAEEAFVADQGRKPGAIPRASRRNHRRPRSPSNRRPTHPGTYAQPHAGAGAVVGSEMLHLREVRAAATAVALMHRLHQSSLNPLTRSPRTLCQSGPGCCKAVGLARPGGMRYLVRRPLKPTRFWRFRSGLHRPHFHERALGTGRPARRRVPRLFGRPRAIDTSSAAGRISGPADADRC